MIENFHVYHGLKLLFTQHVNYALIFADHCPVSKRLQMVFSLGNMSYFPLVFVYRIKRVLKTTDTNVCLSN